jgi:hypothetical protein
MSVIMIVLKSGSAVDVVDVRGDVREVINTFNVVVAWALTCTMEGTGRKEQSAVRRRKRERPRKEGRWRDWTRTIWMKERERRRSKQTV